MFTNILVATDGSAMADKALALALRAGSDARVTGLLVAPDYGLAGFARASFAAGQDVQRLREDLLAEGRRVLDAALARHGATAAKIERLVALNDRPYEAIVATAERLHCDVIVMASHGREAVASALLGSQTLKVLASARIPVLVAR
jgi:nucleotide-binding universal stress UspA family protein